MKKHIQLGMNPGTAAYHLLKDVLYDFVQKAGHVCYRCGGELTRETFSIEHKEPWLDSADPVGLFFDLDNIGFSHRSCNIAAARQPRKIHASETEGRRVRDKRWWNGLTKEQQQARRREKYLKYGC